MNLSAPTALYVSIQFFAVPGGMASALARATLLAPPHQTDGEPPQVNVVPGHEGPHLLVSVFLSPRFGVRFTFVMRDVFLCQVFKRPSAFLTLNKCISESINL